MTYPNLMRPPPPPDPLRKRRYFCKPCQCGWYDTDNRCWACGKFTKAA